MAKKLDVHDLFNLSRRLNDANIEDGPEVVGRLVSRSRLFPKSNTAANQVFILFFFFILKKEKKDLIF